MRDEKTFFETHVQRGFGVIVVTVRDTAQMMECVAKGRSATSLP